MLSHFPTQPTPFVGRVHELADVGACLANPECRLLTITGGGGSGKTRLALAAAEASQMLFADGAVFVDLQPLRTLDLLLPTIAHALGFSFYGSSPAQPQLSNFLHEKHLLLVLDNFEHLLENAQMISDLLADAIGVKILVTSREALNLQEEWLYPLRGMAAPPSIYSAALEDFEAVQLFLYHAHRMQPHFNFAEQSEAVIRICNIAEGMPLAIELAASWLKGLSAEQIACEMQGNLDFLATTARNVEERHRSIRAAFDQSWKLLTEDERTTFAKLSAFCGGFERDAAEEIAGATLPMLVALVEKSLLSKQPEDRWDVHELLRQYGEEQLTSLGILEDAFTAHSRYYADFMRQQVADLKNTSQLDVLSAIEGDFDNIRTAWNWALAFHQDDVIDSMLESLYQFGFVRSRFRETLEMFQQALDQRPANQRLLGRLLARRWGYLHWLSEKNYQEALENIQQALAIATAAEDRFEMAFCKLMIAYIWIHQEEYAEARYLLKESLALFHEINEPFYECWVLHRIGYAYSNEGDIESAVEWTEKSLALARSTPNLGAVGNSLYNLAGIYLLTGNYSKSTQYFEEALQVVLSLRNQGQIAHTTALLSLAAFLRGDFTETRRLAQEGWQIGEAVVAPTWQAYPLSLLILLNCMDEDYSEATRLANLGEAHGADTMGFQLYYWARAVLAFGLDDEENAHCHVQEALRLALQENSLAIEIALLPSAAYALADTQPARAVQLLAWADHSADSATLWMKQWARVDRLRAELHNQLGPAAFEREWKHGAALEWEAVLATLLEEFQDTPAAISSYLQSPLDHLTARELDVLALLATGLTNPQIADHLVIGIGTVKTHTLNIYRKLDVANRSQAIIRAQEVGLLSV